MSSSQSANEYSTSQSFEAHEPLPDVTGPDDGYDVVDEWGSQSFPASDPPQNW